MEKYLYFFLEGGIFYSLLHCSLWNKEVVEFFPALPKEYTFVIMAPNIVIVIKLGRDMGRHYTMNGREDKYIQSSEHET
jgi:hypothetical protein